MRKPFLVLWALLLLALVTWALPWEWLPSGWLLLVLPWVKQRTQLKPQLKELDSKPLDSLPPSLQPSLPPSLPWG